MKREPDDEQRYYVSSVYTKNYSTEPLDTFHIKKSEYQI